MRPQSCVLVGPRDRVMSPEVAPYGARNGAAVVAPSDNHEFRAKIVDDNPQAAIMALARQLHEESQRQKQPVRRLARFLREGAPP